MHGTPFVTGALEPVISLSPPTATSVTVSWTQPPFSFPVASYGVFVTRVTGSGPQQLCQIVSNVTRTHSANDTTELFEDLLELSTYRARVRVNFQSASFGSVPSVFAETEFTTQSAGK